MRLFADVHVDAQGILKLDGGGDCLITETAPRTVALTMGCMFKTTDTGTLRAIICLNFATSTFVRIQLSTSRLRFDYRDDGAVTTTTITDSESVILADGEWHTAFVTISGINAPASTTERIKIYRDGRLIEDEASPEYAATNPTELVIGARNTAGSYAFEADIKRGITFERALEGYEILQLHDHWMTGAAHA
jgi:hypothetical protein